VGHYDAFPHPGLEKLVRASCSSKRLPHPISPGNDESLIFKGLFHLWKRNFALIISDCGLTNTCNDGDFLDAVKSQEGSPYPRCRIVSPAIRNGQFYNPYIASWTCCWRLLHCRLAGKQQGKRCQNHKHGCTLWPHKNLLDGLKCPDGYHNVRPVGKKNLNSLKPYNRTGPLADVAHLSLLGCQVKGLSFNLQIGQTIRKSRRFP